MTELERIAQEVAGKLKVEFSFYAENSRPQGQPVCEKQFEGVTDDGEYTYFRFLYRNIGYIGCIAGVGEVQNNYATLLPAYIEGFVEKEGELSKNEQLKRILRGEATSIGIYKYITKYSVKETGCFVIVLRVKKLMDETLALLEQYGGNSLDTAVQMSEDTCALVRFVREEEGGYRSSVDYAECLVQSVKEELGIDAFAGVGPIVKGIKEAGNSYAGAENALRYADEFEIAGSVHPYREFILNRMMEDIPQSKRMEYLSEITDEEFKEIFEDEEMLITAEEFLQSSLNVSETSRNLYMHRNTLLYRLDKIEKSTGLNIRLFSDAVSFRVLTVLYKLLKK